MSGKWISIVAVMFGAVILLCQCSFGKVMYVDDDGDTTGDGTQWASAYKFLQDALDTAQDGDEIRVAAGTHYPDQSIAFPDGTGDTSVSFVIPGGVQVYGGFAGIGADNPDTRDFALYTTVLNGDLARNDGPPPTNYEDNSWHVVRVLDGSETTVIDGLTIRGGHAEGPPVMDNFGGGMLLEDGSPTVSNCIFTENYRGHGGGGIFADRCHGKVIDCRFEFNQAYYAGGLYDNYGSLDVINCTFTGNEAYYGGAFYANYNDGTLINCTFTGNRAVLVGGAISMNGCALSVINCSFAMNGSALYLDSSEYAYPSDLSMINSIVWGDGANSVLNYDTSTVNITYSLVDGGYPGKGNRNVDPLFVDTPDSGGDGWGVGGNDNYGDLRLQSGSPAIDAGYSLVDAGTVDLDHNKRYVQASIYPGIIYHFHMIPDTMFVILHEIDMGAYEYQLATTGDTVTLQAIELNETNTWHDIYTGNDIYYPDTEIDSHQTRYYRTWSSDGNTP